MIASIIYNGREIPIGDSNTSEIKNDINNINNNIDSINTEINTMKVNFQVGCDTIVGALTAKGVTPTTNSPANISSAINNMNIAITTKELFFANAFQNHIDDNIPKYLDYAIVNNIVEIYGINISKAVSNNIRTIVVPDIIENMPVKLL